MRIFILLSFFLLAGTAAYAQLGSMNNNNMNGMNMMGGMNGRGGRGGHGGHGRQRGSDAPMGGSSEVYMVVDQKPQFPGDSLQQFLSHNLIYPEQAKKDSLAGGTLIKIIVHRDGSIDAPDIIRSSGYDELDNEALRVIMLMPKWVPGRIADKDVDAYAKVLIEFPLK